MIARTIPHRMTVADVMTTEVVTIAPETPVKVIGELLQEHRISGLPVVAASGEIVGMVTEADLLLGSEITSGERFEPLTAPRRERKTRAKAQAETAAEAMSAPVVTVTSDVPLPAVARVMRKHGVKRLPVVDDAGRLVGILSRRDILSALARPDEDIQRDVVEGVMMAWMWLCPADLKVTVEDGIVALAGRFERRSDVEIAERLVRGLDGVVAVNSKLTFGWDDTNVRANTEHRFE